MFDIIRYYEDQNVEYHLPGEKNVTRGWVNVRCVFPDCDDPSWHLGYNHESGFFNCHVCGKKGVANYLVAVMEKCSLIQANTIIAEYEDELLDLPETRSKGSEPLLAKRSSSALYKGVHFAKEWSDLYINYLRNRNFDPDVVIPKYKLRLNSNSGKYKFRIIIPVILKGRVVSFTARDATERSGLPYRHCPDEQGLVPIKHCLYNIDTVKKRVMVVEGPTVVWRLGGGAVATLGINFTDHQVHALLTMGLEEAYVIFDAEEKAQGQARQLADRLSVGIGHIEVIELGGGLDPGSLSERQARDLTSDLGF